MSSRLISLLNKPEYFFRPGQLLRRLGRLYRAPSATIVKIALPWGLDMRVHPLDALGSALWRLGVYDLVTSEVIWRLLDPGDHAVDIGANIGYMTGLMAARTGHGGKVTSIEPHPLLFAELTTHIQDWATVPGIAPIEARQVAISNQHTTGFLNVPHDFEQNRGTASLARHAGGGENYEVSLTTVDNLLTNKGLIALIKIDVEGYEAAVVEGAAGLLNSGTVRDIVFEDHGQYPTPAMTHLLTLGYALFGLARTFRGPCLVGADEARAHLGWDPPSYVATLDPDRTRGRLKGIGWCVLGLGPYHLGR